MDTPPRDDAVFARVYEELRALAQRRVRQGLAGTSLQATALVHEVWLKLSSAEDSGVRDPARYYATAAQAMRWILVDRARRRRMRGARSEESVNELAPDEEAADAEVLALDEVLERLERTHPRKAEVVMHRYFAGLSVEETAAALDISTATVKREWRFARAWLLRELGAAVNGEDSGDS